MLDTVMHWIGFGLCHQLPQRTLVASGHLLPVCARDTGIYAGFMLSFFIVVALDRGRRSAGGLSRVSAALCVLFVIAMGLDGVSSYAGWRETTNALRLATGLMAGFGLGALTVPLLAGQLWKSPGGGRLLTRPADIALWLGSLGVAFVLGMWVLPMTGVVYPLLVTACIVGTFTIVASTLVCALTSLGRRAVVWRDAVPVFAVSLGLACLEIAAAAGAKTALVALVGLLSP